MQGAYFMIPAKGYAVASHSEPLRPFSFDRRELGSHDVLIEIAFCGVCHSDIHQARNEWGRSMYPMVPGHEIVGKIRQCGSQVDKFSQGDTVGVGCMVDACKTCHSCDDGLEQYCENGFVSTYNGYEKDGKTVTHGGYADCIVVHQDFVLNIPAQQDLAKVAPLLCAGITTYSPLKFFKAGPDKKVAIVGLGGLGHVALKLSKAMGAHTTLLTHSPLKEKDGYRLGADQVIVTSQAKAFKAHQSEFDLIINTASGDLDLASYVNLLKREGTLVLLGIPEKPLSLPPSSIILKRRMVAGSLIGGIKETQEMLDFCAKHQITSDIELIAMKDINQAYERVLKGDVKYRFVIDLSSLPPVL